MGSFSGLGIGLSLVFGCIFFAVVAELYYVLWWKKRIINHRQEIEDEYRNHAKDYLIQLFCRKKQSSLHNSTSSTEDCERGQVNDNGHEVAADPAELGTTNKDLLLLKAASFGDESELSELMRLHNLAGPPRFLCTIKEETKEDLESNDAKSRGDLSGRRSITRSLSDLVVVTTTTTDSPFLTPLASPPQGFKFNPLFESSSTEAELNRLRSSSPPPKLKFLRDAEEKLLKRLIMIEEAEKKRVSNYNKKEEGSVQDSGVKTLNTSSSNLATEVREGSFLKFIVGGHHLLQKCPSSTSSQVLPLASSSPTKTFRPVQDQKQTYSALLG